MSLKEKILELRKVARLDGFSTKPFDDVLGLLDEATKQIQIIFHDTDNRANDLRVISVVRGLQERVLAVLEVKKNDDS